MSPLTRKSSRTPSRVAAGFAAGVTASLLLPLAMALPASASGTPAPGSVTPPVPSAAVAWFINQDDSAGSATWSASPGRHARLAHQRAELQRLKRQLIQARHKLPTSTAVHARGQQLGTTLQELDGVIGRLKRQPGLSAMSTRSLATLSSREVVDEVVEVIDQTSSAIAVPDARVTAELPAVPGAPALPPVPALPVPELPSPSLLDGLISALKGLLDTIGIPLPLPDLPVPVPPLPVPAPPLPIPAPPLPVPAPPLPVPAPDLPAGQ